MKTITLISPYRDLQAFGMRTISACLKRKGHDVRLLFLPKHFAEPYDKKTLDQVVELSEGSSLVGISLMTNFFDDAVQITEKLKKHEDTTVLWGGIHPTIRPEECLNYADMVCIGEGEEAIVELTNRIEDGRDYSDVGGIWFKGEKEIVKNPIRPLIRSLDDVPFPDYDYTTHFLLTSGRVQSMDAKTLSRRLHRTYMTMPTRGCPFKCAYCCNNAINRMYPNQKPLRKRSVDNIIKELTEAKKQLPFMERVKFDDDAFFALPTNEIEEFSKEYKKNVNLPLSVTGAAPSTLSREKLSLLVEAGLDFVRMGIQTGSHRTKKLYRRQETNYQVERAVKVINEFKDRIRVPQYDIILDNPWETDEDLIETLMFLSGLPTPCGFSVFSLTFYPGTELYEKAVADGIIVDDLKDVYRKHFRDRKKTYLNNLFVLLNHYSMNGGRISPKTMSLLTNKKMRQLNLHWPLYVLLRAMVLPLRMKRSNYLGLIRRRKQASSK